MKSTVSVGIGFRRDIANEINEGVLNPDFLELAPENWIDMGGYWKREIDRAAEKYDITCHGLSLSIGSTEPLDWDYLKKLKKFLHQYKVKVFSEHLSYTKSANAHLYDLLPIPFRKDAADHIVERIRVVQDFLERPLVLENVSYYTPVAAEMTEAEFINDIVKRADCQMLLDVNNVYVNAFNHKYDAKEFLMQMPMERVAYIHMAGHEKLSEDIIIDTHGRPIIQDVFDLFDWTLPHLRPVPVLLERDFNFEDLPLLKTELASLKKICKKHWVKQTEHVA